MTEEISIRFPIQLRAVHLCLPLTLSCAGGTLKAAFAESGAAFAAAFRDVQRIHAGDLPPYAGPVEVLPSFRVQVLPTGQTSMARDVTVHPILVTEVSNPGGGKTLSI